MNLKIYNDKLTIIIVSFHSKHIIEDLINVLEKNIKIIIIENSLNDKFKSDLDDSISSRFNQIARNKIDQLDKSIFHLIKKRTN